MKATLDYVLPVAVNLQVDPPGVFALSLVGMRGWKISSGGRFKANLQPIERDPFLVSQVLVDSDGTDSTPSLRGWWIPYGTLAVGPNPPTSRKGFGWIPREELEFSKSPCLADGGEKANTP